MGSLKILEDTSHAAIGNILNHISVGLVTCALFCDVVKMNFGLDPAVAVSEFYNKSV